MSTPGVLTGVIQPYAWGSQEVLPRLLGVPPTGEPQAELWLGAHPRGSSVLRRHGKDRPLHQVIADDPIGELGANAVRSFGEELPFLLKILAVDQPLSLQTHPTRQQAHAGFDAEEEEGIPIDADHRLYRDRNHKPELICALEPFTAFCGFRTPGAAAALLGSLEVAELAPAISFLETSEIDQALEWLLELSLESGTEIATQVVEACTRPGPFPDERQWAVQLGKQHPGDIGVAIALLLNLVRLESGQALYLGAGNLHVYLHGVAVEIMASSDNVLRGGLTIKHVDRSALLEVVDCRPTEVLLQTPDGLCFDYLSPVPDFSLTRIELSGAVRCSPTGPEIVLCAVGEASAAGESITSGGAVWVPAGSGDYEISGTGLLFRARTNQPI